MQAVSDVAAMLERKLRLWIYGGSRGYASPWTREIVKPDQAHAAYPAGPLAAASRALPIQSASGCPTRATRADRLKLCHYSKVILAVTTAMAVGHAGMAVADAQGDAQRALIQRQQQSDDFALRLRQSQQMLNPGGAAQRQRMESMNLEQRQRLQNLNEQQIMQLQSTEQSTASPVDTLPARSSYQQQRLEQERQLQLQNFEHQQRQPQRE
jgi:hypothetical protein